MWLQHMVVIMIAMSLWHGTVCQAQQSRRQRLILFSAQEAQQLRFPQEEWRSVPRTRALTRGPRIVVQQPRVRDTPEGRFIETSSPARLSIAFEQNNAPVDMTSLQVRARKSIFTKSLTSLLSPYIQGTSLLVENVEIPEGRFRIEIEVSDINGVKTSETYGLDVKK